MVADRADGLADGAALAADALDTGAADTLLDRWIAYR
jgi:anthranilate phosphoribosyltransferase